MRQELPETSEAWLAEQLQTEKESQPLLKALNRCIPIGREAAEHCVRIGLGVEVEVRLGLRSGWG